MKKINLLLIISLSAIVLFSCKNETVINENQNQNQPIEAVVIENENAEIVQNLDDDVKREVVNSNANSSRVLGTNENENENEKATLFSEKVVVKNPFYQDNPTQKFAIPKGETTIIFGEQGTKITLNSNDFIYESNGQAVEKPIQIELQEYYELSDILKANLTTTTKDEILETGGMIHLAAFANGEKLALKTGKMVEIGFPFETKKEGMQLFSGERDTDDVIVWETMNIQPEEEKETNEIFDVVENMPLWKGCDKANWTEKEKRSCSNNEMMKFVRENLKYPTIAREHNIQGLVVSQFIIEKDGCIDSIKILTQTDSTLNKEAIRIIEKFPPFTAGYQNNQAVRVRLRIPMQFKMESKYSLYEIEDLKNKFLNDSTLKTASKNEIEYYVFKSTNLGWINCDRFNTTPLNKQIELDVKIQNSKNQPSEDVKMIFHSMKSVLNQDGHKGKFVFKNIPKNETVTLFALKFENQQYYMAIQETVTKENQTIKLNFEPVTLAKLQATMKQFDALF